VESCVNLSERACRVSLAWRTGVPVTVYSNAIGKSCCIIYAREMQKERVRHALFLVLNKRVARARERDRVPRAVSESSPAIPRTWVDRSTYRCLSIVIDKRDLFASIASLNRRVAPRRAAPHRTSRLDTPTYLPIT
jgi:hypothetical protein